MSITGSFSLTRGHCTLKAEFALQSKGITIIFGRSGAGKSLFLRTIAGLEKDAKGSLHVNGECWFDSHKNICLPPHKRSIGYVFQQARLFPHLSVEDNILYGYKRLRSEEQTIDPRDVIEGLELESLMERGVHHLSGGEQQRIAIARSLLTCPKVLLMDEPVSALDFMAKDAIIATLQNLNQRFQIPILFVTHSREELKKIGDDLLIIEKGTTYQKGSEFFTRACVQFGILCDRDNQWEHSTHGQAV